MFGKILGLGIIRRDGFRDGGYIEYQVGGKKIRWAERTTLAEDLCMKFGIKREDEMYKLTNKRFEILGEEIEEEGGISYLVRLVNKKMNPAGKTFWLYNEA